jgi:hypothetical protein
MSAAGARKEARTMALARAVERRLLSGEIVCAYGGHDAIVSQKIALLMARQRQHRSEISGLRPVEKKCQRNLAKVVIVIEENLATY